MRHLNTFFLKIYIKSGNITEKKNKKNKFLTFLNIKMSAKSKKIEFNEEFIAMWREEQRLYDVMSPLYRDKTKKDKSLKRMSDRFQIFSD